MPSTLIFFSFEAEYILYFTLKMDVLLAKVATFIESFAYLGTMSHVVHLPMVDTPLMSVADSLGMSLTLIKYTVGLFLVYPFSFIFYMLPGKNLKHLFSFLTGFILMQWVFGPDWIHSFVSAAVTYLICLVVPRRYSAVTAFVWVMGYMSVSHLYRMYVSYLTGEFDFTGTQMVLTMKLTSFAYNLYDGTYDYERVFKHTHPDKEAKVFKQRKQFAITSLPNPLEFFGYIYCFTCILAGPAFEYTDYVSAMEDTAPSATDKKPLKKPQPFLPAMLRLLVGVLCLVGHLQLAPHFKISSHYQLQYVSSKPALLRFADLLVAMFAERLKYYFAWKVAEGASILAGFGFEGFNASNQPIGWRGVENIEIINWELAPNLQSLTRYWNKRTQGWLERYTYHRTNKSLFMTYFVSAFWHGFYPGFFIVFLTVPLFTNIERLMKQKINPLVVPGYDGYNVKTYPSGIVGFIYWYACWMGLMFSMNYLAEVYSMGSLERSIAALSGFSYWGHIAGVVVYVLLEFILPKPKSVKKTA